MERLDKDAAVSCSLNDEEFQDRRALARHTLIPKVESCRRDGDILRFTFHQSIGLRQTIEDFIELEQQCCGFLTFEVVDIDDEQPIILKIYGPPEATTTLDIFAAAIENGHG